MKTEKEIRKTLKNIENEIVRLKLEGCDARGTSNNWIYESNKQTCDYYGAWVDALRSVLNMPSRWAKKK